MCVYIYIYVRPNKRNYGNFIYAPQQESRVIYGKPREDAPRTVWNTYKTLVHAAVCAVLLPAYSLEVAPLSAYRRGLNIYSKLAWKWSMAPFKTTILFLGPSMSFHVNLGEGTNTMIPYS